MNAFPSYVDLEFTARCNLACGFCFGPHDDRRSADLGHEFWGNVIAEVARRGAQGIVVSGGEPTLVAGLPALLAAAKALGLKTVVSTHGRLTSKVAKIAAHCDWIALPADAASREGLIEMRGDAWGLPQAAALARELKEVAPHVRIKLGSVGTRLNTRELVRLAQDLRAYDPMPFDTWKIYQYTPRRKFASRRELYEISDARFAALENAMRATGVTESIYTVFSSHAARRRAYLFVYPDGTVAIPNEGESFGDLVLGNAGVDGMAVFDRVAALLLGENTRNFEVTYG